MPMRIYPAVHYTMGGLWVDYNLMSNVPGLYVLGEANFSDHGANRLGASALMQGLADGYFVLPATISDYLAPLLGDDPVPTDDPVFAEAAEQDVARPGAPSALGQRHAVGRLVPPRARQDHVGQLRHGPQRGEPREGARGDPAAARGVLVRRPGPRRRTSRSTSRSRRPAGSPTSSSSASCCAATRSTARRAAAATSGSSTRPRRARRCATTTTSPTSAHGSTRATRRTRRCTRSRSSSSTSHLAQRSYK